jgi:foldase protein PrsA
LIASRRTANVALLASLALAVGCESEPTRAPGGPPPLRQEPAQRAPKSDERPRGDVAPATDPVVARVENVQVTQAELMRPLVEAHGLPMLLNLVQLEMATADATRQGITVSDADVQAEEDRTLKRMFSDATEVAAAGGAVAGKEPDPSEYPALLEQFLLRRNMSRGEWRMLMRINATLRKLAEPKAKGAINDEQLDEAFKLLYGEKAQALHIQLGNLQEVAEAKRRLDAGESFEEVAKALSRNSRTGPMGGELPPFTRQSPYPQAFKDAAFALQEGQVSDPVMAEGAYHLIKLVRRLPPTVIKFEDVKEGLREDLEEKLTQQLIQAIREDLSARAQRGLRIEDQALRAQFDAEQLRRERQLRDRDEIRREMERERERAATQQAIPDFPAPATQPATQPGS